MASVALEHVRTFSPFQAASSTAQKSNMPGKRKRVGEMAPGYQAVGKLGSTPCLSRLSLTTTARRYGLPPKAHECNRSSEIEG
jgi:hypothetical protein